jgi:hypothetical protein
VTRQELNETIARAASIREQIELLQEMDEPLGPDGEAALYDLVLEAARNMDAVARWALARID